MSDDLVKRLRELTCNCYDAEVIEAGKDAMDEAADHIEKLEALVEQLRDDNSSLIDSFDKDFLRQEARIEKLEAALREIAQTVTIVDENWHPSYHDFSFTQKQAEGAYEELGRRIQIARKTLEGKDD